MLRVEKLEMSGGGSKKLGVESSGENTGEHGIQNSGFPLNITDDSLITGIGIAAVDVRLTKLPLGIKKL